MLYVPPLSVLVCTWLIEGVCECGGRARLVFARELLQAEWCEAVWIRRGKVLDVVGSCCTVYLNIHAK